MQLDHFVITNSRISVLYQPIAHLRRSAFDIEQALENQFLPPEILPIPDNAPPQIPRIRFVSKNEHSKLEFTQSRVDLVTTYDEHFHNDLNKCLGYILEKGTALRNALSVLEPDIAFFALNLKVRWPQSSFQQSAILADLQEAMHIQGTPRRDLYNFKVHYAVKENDQLFRLITLSDYSVYSLRPSNSRHYPRFNINTEAELTEHGFEKEIEINDRLAYNTGSKSFGFDQLESFIELIKTEINQPFPSNSQ